MPDTTAKLRIVKATHTIAWAFFVGCILAIPVFAWRREFSAALILIAIVFVEVLILFANNMRCPLTGIAARYTDERRENFDIFLPLWVARYNKRIFGTLYVAAALFTLVLWL